MKQQGCVAAIAALTALRGTLHDAHADAAAVATLQDWWVGCMPFALLLVFQVIQSVNTGFSINTLLAGKPVAEARTSPVGCYITPLEFFRKNGKYLPRYPERITSSVRPWQHRKPQALVVPIYLLLTILTQNKT